ncbi:hypothetical protein PYCCODRAFT_1472853 [Trametes coccinea BRFM310]|uniref:Uncharacterized protein n=1 Tax=Trametes coccinea (strain BRFM310) TaxID=1353009 RepID=A0A1Y2I4U8_TRAC3|nr:hypothetical protein PYCCODRAFT_1472853 [Trametes coccinea BRFM310]
MAATVRRRAILIIRAATTRVTARRTRITTGSGGETVEAVSAGHAKGGGFYVCTVRRPQWNTVSRSRVPDPTSPPDDAHEVSGGLWSSRALACAHTAGRHVRLATSGHRAAVAPSAASVKFIARRTRVSDVFYAEAVPAARPSGGHNIYVALILRQRLKEQCPPRLPPRRVRWSTPISRIRGACRKRTALTLNAAFGRCRQAIPILGQRIPRN